MTDRFDYTKDEQDWKPFLVFLLVVAFAFVYLFSHHMDGLHSQRITGSASTRVVSATNDTDVATALIADVSSVSYGIYIDNVFEFWREHKGENYTPLVAKDRGVVIFTIKDGDEPQGPGCDFGLLLKIAKRDYSDPALDTVAKVREQLRACSPKGTP